MRTRAREAPSCAGRANSAHVEALLVAPCPPRFKALEDKVKTAMRRLPLNQPNFTVHRERDMRDLGRLALLLCCGLVLAGGFVFAAGQHFAAVRYGYQSEELRRERAALLEEQRRLLLAREEATSPIRLETAARALGMQAVEPAQVGVGQRRERETLSPPVSALVNTTTSLKR
jgi:cell division protein FtsL